MFGNNRWNRGSGRARLSAALAIAVGAAFGMPAWGAQWTSESSSTGQTPPAPPAPASAPSAPAAPGTTVTSTNRGDGSSSVSIIDQRDGRNVLIELRNDQVTRAEIDGKPIPPEQVVREGRTIMLKDEAGNVLYERELPRSTTVTNFAPRAWTLSPQGTPRPLMPRFAQPTQKSMIGVRLGEVDQALRRHFALKPGEATMIYSVSEGLPADAAGLRAYDIIIGIDGKNAANEEFVRATLREKDPGSSVSMTVIQRGQTKTLTVTPDKYDREKLESAKPRQVSGLFGGEDESGTVNMFVEAVPPVGWEGSFNLDEDAQRALEESLAQAHNAWRGYFIDDEGNEMSVATPEAEGIAKAELERSLARLHGIAGAPVVGRVVGPDGQSRTQVFVNGEPSADFQRRMNEWQQERAELMRQFEERQREVAERMRELHQQLHQMQQRLPRTPGQPTPPPPPSPEPAPASVPGGGQS